MKLPFKKFSYLIPITVLIFISACGGSGGEENLTVSDIVDPISLPDTSVPSCINYSSIENTQYCTFSKDGLAREFYIYVPNGYSENISPVSMLFSLHGGGDNAQSNMQYSGFKEQADSDAFIIIYPQGAYYDEKATTGWNTEDGGVNDVAFIESIIDWTGNNFNVQLNEVYVAGFSNGGFMAYHLACYLSPKIAAIAPVAGLMGNYTYDTCSPLHPTPLAHIHGLQDDVISINGGDYHRPLEDNGNTTGVISFWQDFNQCTEFSQEPLYNGEETIGTLNKWTNCSNGAFINYWIISNQGHEWNEGDKDESASFDTSQILWNFLKQFDMNGLKVNK